jgi:hypothetical protein
MDATCSKHGEIMNAYFSLRMPGNEREHGMLPGVRWMDIQLLYLELEDAFDLIAESLMKRSLGRFRRTLHIR